MTRVAIISDIHSNIDAFKTVLEHIDKVGVDMTICLGDIVGYGPCPNECLQLVHDREIPCVMGNHDEYVTLLMDPRVEKLRPEIRQAVEWTQGQISMSDLKWLSKLPMRMDADVFEILHASYSPVRWAYCMDEDTFATNFKHQTSMLAFCGHSHAPLIAFDVPDAEKPLVDYIRGLSHKMTLPKDQKIMVNVGSVGQPRDHDPRSCVVFYEVEARQIWLDRVPYDTKVAKQRFEAAGLPQKFADRILIGK